MLGFSRISRYIAAELLTPTILGLMLWTFVLLMNHFFYVAERALSKNLSFDLTLQLFLTGLPSILILSIPMSVLLGSLIAMGRISADQEWVALQGAGGGPGKLIRPLVIHGLLASLLGVYVYGELAPRANYLRRDLQGEILFSSNLAADLKPRIFYTELENSVLFVDDIRSGSQGRLDGVILIRHDPRKNDFKVILAESGDLYPAADRSGTLIMDLSRGAIHNYRPEDPETYTWARSFEALREPIHPPDYLKSFLEPPEKVVSDMRLVELWDEFQLARRERARTLEQIAASGTDERSARADRFLADNRVRVATVELHSRVALPFASLCFALLALPLGITRARSGKGAGFAVSLLVILVYWTIFTFCRDQSASGKFPAVLGPWSANLVMLPWAAYGIWRMRRPTDSAGPIAKLFGVGVRGAALLRSLVVRRRAKDPETEAADAEALGDLALENVSGTSNRFVFRLDQFIASAYLRVLALTLASALLIYSLVKLKGLTDGLLRTQQPASLLLSYFKYFAPTVLHILLPISCLVGSVVAFTVLARTGELTAIKASGTSMRRAIMPVVVVTGLLCGLLYLVQDSVAPVFYRKAHAIEDQILGRAPKTYGMPAGGRWQFGPEGRRLFHYRVYDKTSNEFQALTVFTLDREAHRVLDHRYAKRARWLGDAWELEDSWYRTFESNGSLGTFELHPGLSRLEPDFRAELATEQLSRQLQSGIAEQLSLTQISEEIEELEASGYDTTRLRVAFHGKIARILAPMVMVLLGLPFAFRVGRRGSLYGIGVALLLVLVYWAVFAIFNALGLETLLEPWAAAWAPNILFGLLGSYLLLYIRT